MNPWNPSHPNLNLNKGRASGMCFLLLYTWPHCVVLRCALYPPEPVSNKSGSSKLPDRFCWGTYYNHKKNHKDWSSTNLSPVLLSGFICNDTDVFIYFFWFPTLSLDSALTEDKMGIICPFQPLSMYKVRMTHLHLSVMWGLSYCTEGFSTVPSMVGTF